MGARDHAPPEYSLGLTSSASAVRSGTKRLQGICGSLLLFAPLNCAPQERCLDGPETTWQPSQGLAAVTVKGFEYLGADSKVSTVQKMLRALEAAGIQFIDEDADGGVGVRLRSGVRLRGAGGAKLKR